MIGKRYFKITGLDEGHPIEPYIINSQDEDLNYHLDCGTYDKSRHYEEISKEEAIEYLKGQNAELQIKVDALRYQMKELQKKPKKARNENE